MASTDESQPKRKRTILIAMDDSDHARFALNWFKENLYLPNDQVFVVYSTELSNKLQGEKIFEADLNKDIAPIIAEEKKKHQNRLEAITAALEKTGISEGKVKGIHSKNPGEGICEAAKTLGANIIVTGTRGLGTIRRTFMGSVSGYVLEHASVPVIVCRPCQY